VNFGLIEQMETRVGGTAMQHLLGHGVTIGISSLLCALEHGRSEQQSAIPNARCVSLFHGLAARKADLDLPVFGLTASPGSVEFVSFRCESPQINSSLARSLLRGFCDARRQARSSALLSHPAGYGFHLRWTLRKCRASALGVAPTRIASPGVTRADREFKSGDSKCF
jgi:hypothetical protein